MATQDGNGERKRRKSKKLVYFFINGDLHKSLHINRSADIITAWNYPQRKRVGYSYSDVKRRAGRAFTTAQVAKMVNRTRLTLQLAIQNGDIEAPQITYNLTNKGQNYKYMWSEDDIMELHAFLASRHKGRPRNDGCITPMKLPNARELRAMIRQEVVLYVKNDDGEFVPTWEAETF